MKPLWDPWWAAMNPITNVLNGGAFSARGLEGRISGAGRLIWEPLIACGANPMVIPSIRLPVGTPTLGGEQVWPQGRGGVWGQVCMVAPSRPPSPEEETQERADAQCPAGC